MQGSILNGIYRVELQLSQRGSRTTYLARDTRTNEPVVIKILKFGFDAQWQDFKLFEREALTLKNIDHPAIPSYLDYFELDFPDCKGFALVQEYIAAPSLEQAIATGRIFSESDIKEIATALLKILIYLHQQQPSIIHRDIKPSNILLTDRSGNSVGQVYLIDFGAVKSVAAAEGGTITVVGTYGYMPPEQFGRHTTPASDLYSLGATLIYLATGRHPTELPSKDGKIAFSNSVQLSNLFTLWLEQMIEPATSKRFKTATEALQALKNYPLVDIKGSVAIEQPTFSQIKLHKSKSKIEILIPSSGLSRETIALALVAVFWNSSLLLLAKVILVAPFPENITTGLFSIPFFAVGLWLVAIILFAIWGKTRLTIDSQTISLAYECLGIKYHQPKASNRKDINAIKCTETGWHQAERGKKTKIVSSVIIWADGKAYTLKSSVKQQTSSADKINHNHSASIELNWLAKELSQWLDLPIARRKAKRSQLNNL